MERPTYENWSREELMDTASTNYVLFKFTVDEIREEIECVTGKQVPETDNLFQSLEDVDLRRLVSYHTSLEMLKV